MLTRATRLPLAALDRIANAELARRLELREPFLRAVKVSARTGVRVGAALRGKLGRSRTRTEAGFDLAPTGDQVRLRDAARVFAAEVLRPAADSADAAAAPPAEVLARGRAVLGFPRSPVTSCLIFEELARGDLGLAVALASPLAVARALADWGTLGQQQRWLPRLTGDAFVPAALAVLEPWPGADPAMPRTGAVRCDGGWRLYGEKALVPLACTAEVLLIAAQVIGRGPRLFLVERGTPGLEIRPEPAMGLRAAATSRVVLHDVLVRADAIVGGVFRPYRHRAIIDGAQLAWSALAVGACQAVLDEVVPHCNASLDGGEPMSHRQGVAFAIANIAIELDGMRLCTWRAAALAERGASFTRQAALARRLCATRGMQIADDGVQLCGATERRYRDLRAIAVMEGAVLV